MFRVYKITNILDGKCYIGMTCRRMCDRWEEHVANSRGKKRRYSKLYVAIAKYGPKAFRKETLATTANENEAGRLEMFYIAKFDSFHKGYNSNKGGHGTLIVTDQTRKKISDAHKGKVISEVAKAKMSLAKLGDKRCAIHFGDHTKKGADNPRAKSFLIRFPDGSEHVIRGMRAFCREHKLTQCKLSKNGKTKGYELLKRLIDYPEMEYSQAAGNGGCPTYEGKDIVRSA